MWWNHKRLLLAAHQAGVYQLRQVAAGRLWRSTDGACVFPKPGPTIKVSWSASARLRLAQMIEDCCWVGRANLTSEEERVVQSLLYIAVDDQAVATRRAMFAGAIVSSFNLAGLGFALWAGRSFPASLTMRIVQHAYLCSMSIMTQCTVPAPF
jgi:hypothetical protein